MSWDCISYWIEQHPGLASWVQAFGSIAALVVAFWVASAQRRSDMKAQRERDQLLLDQVKILAARASRSITFEQMDYSTTMAKLNVLTGLCMSLDKIDLLGLPVAEMLDPICTLRDSLRALESGMREAQRQGYLSTWLTLPTACIWVGLVDSATKQIQRIT